LFWFIVWFHYGENNNYLIILRIMKYQVAIAAFAIITNSENKILLAHRTDKDIRNLPWWGLEAWESPEDTVVRETKEETWLDITIDHLVAIYTKTNKHGIVFVFKCDITWWQLTHNSESDDFIYIDQSSIPSNTIPKQIERINDYYDQINNKLIMKYQ